MCVRFALYTLGRMALEPELVDPVLIKSAA